MGSEVEQVKFPPLPTTIQLSEDIIKSFTGATAPSEFEESGCAVCGEPSLLSKMTKIVEKKYTCL